MENQNGSARKRYISKGEGKKEREEERKREQMLSEAGGGPLWLSKDHESLRNSTVIRYRSFKRARKRKRGGNERAEGGIIDGGATKVY